MAEAFYYPNRGHVVRTIVLDHKSEVNATHDFLAADAECRHFIDRDYLAEVMQEDLISSYIVPATPPCTVLQGTHRPEGDAVLGMLKRRLRVKCYFQSVSIETEEGSNTYQGWVELKLQNVLVVKEMPVPIHISMKGLKASPTMTFGGQLLGAGLFPPRYGTHPYWRPNAPASIGRLTTTGIDEYCRVETALVDGRTGRPNGVKQIACANCGTSERKLSKCAACKKIFYCSRTCQKSHWKTHKPSCVEAK